MKYFENIISFRRLRQECNGYEIHAKLENIIIQQCGVSTPYSYFAIYNSATKKQDVLVRTMQPLGLAGEQERELNIEVGDKVQLQVYLQTSYTVFQPKVEGKEQKRKVAAILDEDKRLEKLKTTIEKNGLSFTYGYEKQYMPMKMRKKGNGFTLSGAFFECHAKVTDKAVFEKAFIEGIGKKRNFGFGMLIKR